MICFAVVDLRDAMEIEESDLVGNPQRPRHVQNVCAKIMAWFGFY